MIRNIESENQKADIFTKGLQGDIFVRIKEVSIWLVRLHMRGIVTRNEIFSIKYRHYGPKRDMLDYWITLVFFYYLIIYFQWIKVYRFEILDIVKISLTHWRQWNIKI